MPIIQGVSSFGAAELHELKLTKKNGRVKTAKTEWATDSECKRFFNYEIG